MGSISAYVLYECLDKIGCTENRIAKVNRCLQCWNFGVQRRVMGVQVVPRIAARISCNTHFLPGLQEVTFANKWESVLIVVIDRSSLLLGFDMDADSIKGINNGAVVANHERNGSPLAQCGCQK